MERFYNFLRKRNDTLILTTILVVAILVVLAPLLQIFSRSLSSNSEYFNVLLESGLFFDGVLNTIELVFKVGFFSSVIGFVLAYTMTFYKIRFPKIVNILLIIPLGIPVYVAAYTYTNIYYTFPFLETIFRSEFLMSGTVFIYVIFLYPYVYIATKSYLSKHLSEYIESANTLNSSKLKVFFKVILPLSRPIIIGSVLFVLFETLSDFAVVEYYGELTLSRYVNLAWFNQGDINTGSKFAVYILLIMFILISSERLSRGKKRYSDPTVATKKHKKIVPTLPEKIIQNSFVYSIIIFGSILPISQMIKSAYIKRAYIERLNLFEVIGNTLLITSISIVLIIVSAIILSSIVNRMKKVKKQSLSSLMVIGYSMPSMILALGAYLLVIRFDKFIYPLLKHMGINTLLISSTIFIIVFGFVLKFFSIGFSNLMSSYQKIDSNMFESAEILGENKLTTLFRINIPLLKKSIKGISIILFIDMVKELTIVYSLRPFNFKTLSTEVYRYAGNEMIEVAAFPSLIIVLLCVILIIILEAGGKNVKTRKH